MKRWDHGLVSIVKLGKGMIAIKYFIGLLFCANMLYFVVRYRELSNTVQILQEQQRRYQLESNNKVIRTADKDNEAKKIEKEKDNEGPALEYSQVRIDLIFTYFGGYDDLEQGIRYSVKDNFHVFGTAGTGRPSLGNLGIYVTETTCRMENTCFTIHASIYIMPLL